MVDFSPLFNSSFLFSHVAAYWSWITSTLARTTVLGKKIMGPVRFLIPVAHWPILPIPATLDRGQLDWLMQLFKTLVIVNVVVPPNYLLFLCACILLAYFWLLLHFLLITAIQAIIFWICCYFNLFLNSEIVQKTPLMQRKESSSVRPKSTMLEKAIKELEKMVADCMFFDFMMTNDYYNAYWW